MKRICTSINALVCHLNVPYLKSNEVNLSKYLLVLGLIIFTIINSSFSKENISIRDLKTNHVNTAVPFKGTFTITFSNNTITGTGEGTHIGRFTIIAYHNDENFPFLTGTGTITAANGDQIFITRSGYIEDIGNDNIRVTFDNTITGGTGRFSGATGSFETISVANNNTSIGTTTFNGTISY